MATLLEAQAFLDQFDKCLPLCERGSAVTVINALHTLNNITQASISQVKELNPSTGHDLFSSFLLELELALELFISPTRKLGTIDGGLPALYSFSEDDLASLSHLPSMSTKFKVKRFLEALGVTPSKEFEGRSVAAVVTGFLKCQVKKPDPSAHDAYCKGRSGVISSNSSTIHAGILKPQSISWADQCSSSSCSNESDLDDMPPLEDGDDDAGVSTADTETTPTPASPSPMPMEPNSVAEKYEVVTNIDGLSEGELDQDQDYDFESEDETRASDEAAYTFLFSQPISRLGDFIDDHDAHMGCSRPAPEEGYGMFGKGGARPAAAARAPDSFYKTRMCKNWEQTGTCQYGSRCNFAHGEQDLRTSAGPAMQASGGAPSIGAVGAGASDLTVPWPQSSSLASASRPSTRRQPEEESERPAQLYKTRMCKNFEQAGTCKFGDKCNFAHGKEDLRRGSGGPAPSNRGGGGGAAGANGGYKKKLCERFASGSCLYADKCTFAHGADDIVQ
jgi:hypothetical protein